MGPNELGKAFRSHNLRRRSLVHGRPLTLGQLGHLACTAPFSRASSSLLSNFGNPLEISAPPPMRVPVGGEVWHDALLLGL